MSENKNKLASTLATNKLIGIARTHFSRYGFGETSLEAIAKEAGFTRGAVYHHFKNKKTLFIAVLQQVQEEVGANVEKTALTSDDPWEQLILGSIGFVEAAIQDTNKRILLIDSLTVVDWEEWRKIDQQNAGTHLADQLNMLKMTGQLVPLDPKLIAHMISGALNDLSLYLAHNHPLSRSELHDYITHLLKGFKRDGEKTERLL